WRRSRIDPGFRRISARQRKRSHAEPLGSQVVLYRALRKPILVHDAIRDLQTLPVIDIYDRMTIGVADTLISGSQRVIDISVTALVRGIVRIGDRYGQGWVRCPIGLPGPIIDKPGRDGFINRVAH